LSSLASKVRELAAAFQTWAVSLSAAPPLKWTGRLWLNPIQRSRQGALGPGSRPAGFLSLSLTQMANQLKAIEGRTSLFRLDAERQRLDLLLADVTDLANQVAVLRSEIDVPKSILDIPENQQLGRYHTHHADEINEGVFAPEILGEGEPFGKRLRPGRWD